MGLADYIYKYGLTQLQLDCLIRDEWKCRFCHDTHALHAHHITFRSQGGEDKLNNLITLCYQCHRAVHNKNLSISFIKRTEENPEVIFVRLKNWKPK